MHTQCHSPDERYGAEEGNARTQELPWIQGLSFCGEVQCTALSIVGLGRKPQNLGLPFNQERGEGELSECSLQSASPLSGALSPQSSRSMRKLPTRALRTASRARPMAHWRRPCSLWVRTGAQCSDAHMSIGCGATPEGKGQRSQEENSKQLDPMFIFMGSLHKPHSLSMYPGIVLPRESQCVLPRNLSAVYMAPV